MKTMASSWCSEPSWFDDGLWTTDSHARWRDKCRAWVSEKLTPNVTAWDAAGTFPAEAVRCDCYRAGILGAPWPREYGGTPPQGSVLHDGEFDPYYDMIMWDEIAKCGSGGVIASLFGGHGISLPVILNHGSRYLKDMVARDVICGHKSMCLCVTEPSGGSDVAQLKCTAEWDANRQAFVLNGTKKWITNGMAADYLVVLCRVTPSEAFTGSGLTFLLVDAAASKGLRRTRMRTQGWLASNTAFIEFDEVLVAKENVVGEIGHGFRFAMMNFNHERFMMAVQSARFSRMCLSNAISFASRRQTFGKRLIDHQVIRHKIFEMASKIEAAQLMIERYCHLVTQRRPRPVLYGKAAMIKVTSTKLFEFCAREASQILGGASFTRPLAGREDNEGSIVERLYREVRVMAIGGGSEEVMIDLAIKSARL